MPKEKKKPFDHWKFKYAKLIKIFAALGSITSIIFHIFLIIEGSSQLPRYPIQTVVLPIAGILICIILLGSIGVFGPRWFINVTWYLLLIGGVLEAIIYALVPGLFSSFPIGAWGLSGVLLIIASGLLFLIEAL